MTEAGPSTNHLELQPGQHVHFIGIGGVSMSGLAQALHEKGFCVTGSDKRKSQHVKQLEDSGIEVTLGQAAENIGDAQVIVYSTAISEDNPELVAARATGRPVVHRSELISYLLDQERRIAVSGTHGKTTVTAMIGTIFVELGYDPTVFVGGHWLDIDSNFRLGNGDWAIFEACESDSSFLAYEGCSQILTSIEPDHLDSYGSFEALRDTFQQFVSLADPQGFVAYWADCAEVVEAVADSTAQLISYGLLGPKLDLTATDITASAQGTKFTPIVSGEALAPVSLRIVGRHNILNALAALAAAWGAGLAVEQAAGALGQFTGIKRRFECIGQVDGYRVVDDYAHHPTEIQATLQAAREHFAARIVAVFQPHLYSRTEYLMEEFAESFGEADVIGIAQTYAAREQPREDISGQQLCERIRNRHPDRQVVYLPSLDDVVEFLKQQATSGDLVMTIGAGNIHRAAEQLVDSA